MTAIEFSYTIIEFSRPLKSFAYKLTRNDEDADDLVQETYVKALFNRDKFLSGTNLKAWLYTIMKNTFITNYQKLIRRKTFMDSSDNLHLLNSLSSSTENKGVSDFTFRDITRAIEGLDEIFKEPFQMYFEGFKYHEIAEKLQIPIGTVKNRIHMARKELKDKLGCYAHN